MRKYRLLYLIDCVLLAAVYILHFFSYKKAGLNHHVIFKSKLFIKTYFTGYGNLFITAALLLLLLFSVIATIYAIKKTRPFFDCALLFINTAVLVLLVFATPLHKITVFVYLYKTLTGLAALKAVIVFIVVFLHTRLNPVV